MRSVHHALSRSALCANDDTHKVCEALGDPDKITVVQMAPGRARRVGRVLHADRPGNRPPLVTVCASWGFDYVFDTTFSADLTIMEEGTEFLHRFTHGDWTSADVHLVLPGLGALCEVAVSRQPADLSTAKSPQQMFGAVGKTWLAEKLGVDADKIYSISIMPCIAKKKPSASCRAWIRPVTAAMSIWSSPPESWCMARAEHLDVENIAESAFDSPLGDGTGAGVIFGATGGVIRRPRCVRRTSSPPAKIRRRMHSARCVTTARFLRCRGAKQRSSWQAGLCAAR